MIANLESKKNRLLEEVEQLKRDRDSGKISAEEAKIRLDHGPSHDETFSEGSKKTIGVDIPSALSLYLIVR